MDYVASEQDGYLLITCGGAVTLDELLRVYRELVVLITQGGHRTVIMDFCTAHGTLNTMERYELGSAVATLSQEAKIYPRLALVGFPPVLDGFGALVASNRGIKTEIFDNLESAIAWAAQKSK